MIHPVNELSKLVFRSSQKAVAIELGISQSYLSEVLAGLKEPGPKLLEKLKLEKIVTYRRKT